MRSTQEYDKGEAREQERDEEQKTTIVDRSHLELWHYTFELEIHPIQLEFTPHLFQLTTLPPARTCMVDV